jgi:hypothetical protein
MPRSRLLRLAFCSAGILVLVLAVLIFYAVTTANEGVVGVGASPVSGDLAATWFIESVTRPVQYKLGIIVFLLGKPGWTEAGNEWTSGKGEPAFSAFEISGRRLQIEYSRGSGEWSVLDTAGSVEKANVVVVKGCGTATLEVVHTEMIDLAIPFQADPVTEVVARSSTLRRLLDQE